MPAAILSGSAEVSSRRFARHPHEKGHIGIRNCKARQIDRSGERRVSEPPPKPSRISTRSSRNAAPTNAPKNRSRCAESSLDQPCIVAATRSIAAFAFLLKTGLGKRNHENKKLKYAQ